MIYLIIGILLAMMFLYIVMRKPTWIKQVTPSGRIVHICSNCGEIWTPMQYEVFPPDHCPHCGKEMKTYL